MVLLIHVFGKTLMNETIVIGSFQWHVANIIDGISRCSVPLFFMLSGALLLNKKLETKKFLLGRLKKVAIPFLFWSLI
jgi:surface polysaccharide O-acyltransferase-like enzyme